MGSRYLLHQSEDQLEEQWELAYPCRSCSFQSRWLVLCRTWSWWVSNSCQICFPVGVRILQKRMEKSVSVMIKQVYQMIVSSALVLSCFRSSGPYHRVDTLTLHALNLCEWTRTQQNIGQRHASGTKERRGRKLTDSWPDAVAMAATSRTAWKTFMMLQMITCTCQQGSQKIYEVLHGSWRFRCFLSTHCTWVLICNA